MVPCGIQRPHIDRTNGSTCCLARVWRGQQVLFFRLRSWRLLAVPDLVLAACLWFPHLRSWPGTPYLWGSNAGDGAVDGS
jgi:hypothetical protein